MLNNVKHQYSRVQYPNHRVSEYSPFACVGLPVTKATPIQNHRQKTYHRAIAYLNGFKLICQYDENIGDRFYKQIYPVLKEKLDTIKNSNASQYKQLQENMDEFFTHLVTLLEDKGIQDGSHAIHQATHLVAWQNNTRVQISQPRIDHENYPGKPRKIHETLEIDEHLAMPGSVMRGANDVLCQLTLNELTKPAFQSTLGNQTEKPIWYTQCPQWLQNYLASEIYNNENLKLNFKYGMPPALTQLPGFRQYAQHRFHVGLDGNLTDERTCLRISEIIPKDMPISDEEKIQYAVNTLKDLVEYQIDNKPATAFDSFFPAQSEHPQPLPILLQVPAMGDSRDELLYKAVEEVKTFYENKKARNNIKPIIINAHRDLSHYNRSRHPGSTLTWHDINRELLKQQVEIFKLALNYKLTGLDHIDLPTVDDDFSWTLADTKKLMTALDGKLKKATAGTKLEITRYCRFLEALTDTINMSEQNHDGVNLNLRLMSLETNMTQLLGGITIVHEHEKDHGSVMMMHADAMFQYLMTGLGQPDPIHNWIPACLPKNDDESLSLATFNRFFAEKIETEHHSRFNQGAHPGVTGHRGIVDCLSSDMKELLRQREIFRYAKAYFEKQIQLDNGEFKSSLIPETCRAHGEFFNRLDMALQEEHDQYYWIDLVEEAQQQLARNPFNLHPNANKALLDILKEGDAKTQLQSLLNQRQIVRPQNEQAAKDHIQQFALVLQAHCDPAHANGRGLTDAITNWLQTLAEHGFASRDISRVKKNLLKYEDPKRHGHERSNTEAKFLEYTFGFTRLGPRRAFWQIFLIPIYFFIRLIRAAIEKNYIRERCHSVEGEANPAYANALYESDQLLDQIFQPGAYAKIYRLPKEEEQTIENPKPILVR